MWWKESVVYQVYPRSFNDSNNDGIGDIKGIIEKLDYLAFLGIDVIWLSPVYQSPNDDNGYDISDYQAIMDEFGTMEDFDQLIAEANTREINIMMDLVVNHTSDEHHWFIEAKNNRNSPYRDYYIWKDPLPDGSAPTNWGAAFGGSTWEYDEKSGQYYLHLFSKKQPDLNWENPALRNDIYQMMLYWLDKGVAGFRMDVINMISKDPSYPDGVEQATGYGDGGPYYFNGPRVHEYLQEMNQKVLRKYNTITVGEMPAVNVEEAKLYTGKERNELNMVFHFDHVSLGDGKLGKWTPQEWKLTELKAIFSRWQEGLENEGWNSLYWSNHDQPRAISRFGNPSRQYRERSGKMLATCLHMLKGTPYIYQGEEIGMTNVQFDSIDNYRDLETIHAYHDYTTNGLLTKEEMLEAIHKRSRDNARTPMHWSDEPEAGFTNGVPWIPVNPNYKTINVRRALADKESIFYYYQRLINLRKKYSVIVHGKYQLLLPDDEQLYAYTRTWNDERLLVICNFSDQTAMFQLPDTIKHQTEKILIANMDLDIERDLKAFTLQPYEAVVYILN
ncbi:oligo-1,6-glucosidase [Natronobacillus azotifigens]|uniref:oligo-1,6-glucosidase n=1 Tax=Natronobacillus azotifigens TaxID=472978 RepID=A0A9J6R8X7_9BACI|nr:alpha-glucosidase [Natronobacillus azotifigens]